MSLNSKLQESLKAYDNLDKTVREIEAQISDLEEPVSKSVTYVTYDDTPSDRDDDSELEEEDDDLLRDTLVPDYLREEKKVVVEEDEEKRDDEEEDDLPRVEWKETRVGLDLGFGPGVVVPSISNFYGGTYIKYTGLGKINPDVKSLLSKMIKDLVNQFGTKYGYDVDLLDDHGDYLEVFLPHKPRRGDPEGKVRMEPVEKEDDLPESKPVKKEQDEKAAGDECGRFPKEEEIRRRGQSCSWGAVKGLSVQFEPWKEADEPLVVTIRELFVSESEFKLSCSETQTEREMALIGIRLRRLYNKLYQKYKL
ncbi:phosphoprotein [grass carp rhabdovirus]|uniref:Phosphoprotein n=1 Tax=grass carp rhabdovirus TaxID=2847096 RepID=L7Z365_9RHAB|nr:phosphoprotein [Grass carp virus]AGE10375.1 phosphoprotein [Grass carp virus]